MKYKLWSEYHAWNTGSIEYELNDDISDPPMAFTWGEVGVDDWFTINQTTGAWTFDLKRESRPGYDYHGGWFFV